MKALRQQIQLMAPTNGRVLIYGESGTAKNWSHMPSTVKACAAKKVCRGKLRGYTGRFDRERTLWPSQRLVAHRSPKTRKASFTRRNGGTLFLDEVGDMSLKTQAKVLRTLEEQRFTPVGSDELITVDVR